MSNSVSQQSQSGKASADVLRHGAQRYGGVCACVCHSNAQTIEYRAACETLREGGTPRVPRDGAMKKRASLYTNRHRALHLAQHKGPLLGVRPLDCQRALTALEQVLPQLLSRKPPTMRQPSMIQSVAILQGRESWSLSTCLDSSSFHRSAPKTPATRQNRPRPPTLLEMVSHNGPTGSSSSTA
jgi:hypothetical protein